jgi:hypothetical protein
MPLRICWLFSKFMPKMLLVTAPMTARVHDLNDSDPLAPQREAAFFYGLFLRGHSLEEIRQDIGIPRPIIDRWLRARGFRGAFRADLDRIYEYRKQVLAIFDGLVSSESSRVH